MSAAVQLQPGIFGLYQARNRVLLPRYGRWAQKDPNASGMLHATLWRDGQAPSPELANASLADVLGDGANLFAPTRSSPLNLADPIGLFGLASALMTGLNMFDTMTDVLDQAEQGVRLGASFIDMIDAYQSELYDMIEWALDPNAAWDEYAYGYTDLPGEGSPQADSGGFTLALGGLKGGGAPGWDPRAWIGRKHGGASHQNAMESICRAADIKYGKGKVKFNQALKHPETGTTLRTQEGRSFRPDIQIKRGDGELVVIEIHVSQTRSSADTKVKQMAALLPGSNPRITTMVMTPQQALDWVAKGMP